MTVDQEASASAFAGDLLLWLAAEGRLVLEPGVADETIAGLERTLAQVRDRLRIPAESHCAKARLAQAATELPKYIEAVRRARR